MNKQKKQLDPLLDSLGKKVFPIIIEEIWSPGDTTDYPLTTVIKKELCKLNVKSGRKYQITMYGCEAYLLEPTSWGELALRKQEPLMFLGRHQWKVRNVHYNPTALGLQEALTLIPPIGTRLAASKWESFLEFKQYGVGDGYPTLTVDESGKDVSIEVIYGRFNGATDLPPPPLDVVFFKGILAGYWWSE